MRRQDVTVSAAGVSAPLPVDYQTDPVNIGFGCVISSGATLTYKVQHTYDDVYASGYNPSTGNWFDHPVVAAKTANADGSYLAPITAVRLNVTAFTGGNVTLQLLQATRVS